jgi:hypothetical protein
MGQIMFFGLGKGPAGHAWSFGMETDARNGHGGGNWMYID